MLTSKKLIVRVTLAGLLLIIVMAGCLLIGSQDISLRNVLQGPIIEGVPNSDYQILVAVRLPRIFLAAIVGVVTRCRCGYVFAGRGGAPRHYCTCEVCPASSRWLSDYLVDGRCPAHAETVST